jgi:hypothetical protein
VGVKVDFGNFIKIKKFLHDLLMQIFDKGHTALLMRPLLSIMLGTLTVMAMK